MTYYNVGFTDQDYFDLLSILNKLEGKWLLKQNYMPAVVDWAEKHGYSVKSIRVVKSSMKAIKAHGEAKEGMQVLFIANYKLH
ncbi:MAG: hypothetical protein ACTSXC_08195 [Candidatus Freyarchaeota archaeon]